MASALSGNDNIRDMTVANECANLSIVSLRLNLIEIEVWE